jgi:DNA repair exonuclease SbcCD ATPase subunit
MIIEKLRLKGMTGIKKGLGLDEIEIDFNNISGLVALDGVNGSGKSTCIELLSPFNQLASREGALFRHCYLRDSERELSFTYQGHHYKTLLKIDCDSEKSEGYIWVDDAPVVNGKISAYAKYMKDLFGSPELFYNSVFCSQNAKKLSDMTTGKLKELFSEFLRLDRLVEYENTAKQCANVINGKAGQVDIRIAALKEKLSGIDQARADIEAHEQGHISLVADLDCKKAELSDYRKAVEGLKEKLVKNTIILQRKADIAENIGKLQKELDAEKSGAETEIEALKVKYREVSAELAKFEAVISLETAIREAGNTEARLEKQLIEMNAETEQLTEEISKSLAEIHRLESELLIKRQSVRDLDNDPKLTELTRLILQTQNDIDSKLISLRGLDNDRKLIDLEHKIKQHKESIKKLAFRDPGCPEGENSCLYIKDALAARDALPAAEVEYGERKAEIEKERSDIQVEIDILKGKNKLNERDADARLQENITKQAALSGGATTIETLIKAVKHFHLQYSDQLKTTKENIQTYQKKLVEVKALSERKAELEIAITRKADITAKLEEITAAGKTLRASWTEKEQAKLQQIQELVIKQSEIDKDINHGAETELAITKQNIDDAEKQIPLIEKKIAEVRDLISKANHDLSSMLDAEKELNSIQAEKTELLKNASEWTYLKTACSKNGLQALEIDGAAPLITSFANDLLSQAFGPLFSVKFRTLDDEGKECLDIVTIADDGTEVLLENLSGGQRVWILMALRLAMTLLSQEKSGRVYESAFADEMDGPLDPDNSINFVKMYQAFMQIGKFKTLYFISHKPSCRNLADHILKFEAGENPTWA